MNLQDLNQITTPKEWKQRALSLGDPAPARHPKAKKKLVLAFVVLLCLVLGGGTVLATEIVQHFQNPRVVKDTGNRCACSGGLCPLWLWRAQSHLSG